MEKGELKKKVMKVERRGRDKSFIQTETCIKHALTKLPRAGIRFKVEMNARTALLTCLMFWCCGREYKNN
ncbi:hypothetical protein YC2023_035221 [Brassica napus]